MDREPPDVPISELAIIAATLAQELNRKGLLDPTAAKTIASGLDRLAAHFETDDPHDPQDLEATAAALHAIALLLLRYKP